MDRIIHKQPISCCKYCDSTNIVKYGTFQGMQRYFCKNCRRKFADNDALPKMKTPVWIISLALNCYFEGKSLGAIQQEINRQHGAYYAHSSIYNWIIRFSKEAVRQAKAFQPDTGNTWFLSIAPVIFGNRRLCFVDIFDIDSKFLLASQLFETRTDEELIDFICSTYFTFRSAARLPVTIIVPDTFDINRPSLRVENSESAANLLFKKSDASNTEEFTKILKKRNKVVHGFKNTIKAQILTGAWQVQYNFLMGNNTTRLIAPAYKTGRPLFNNWEDIIKQLSIK